MHPTTEGTRPIVKDCAFCDYDGPSEILWSDRMVFAIEPLHPVTEGHLLFIPRAHVPDVVSSPAMAGIVMEAATNWVSRHRRWMSANFITSVGAAATQTIGHLHLHVVPRESGDGLLLPWEGRL